MGCQKPAGQAWHEPQSVQSLQRPMGQSAQTLGAGENLPRAQVVVRGIEHRACFLSTAQFTQPELVRPAGHLTQYALPKYSPQ